MRSLCTSTKSSPCSLQLEKAHAQQQRPNAASHKPTNQQINKMPTWRGFSQFKRSSRNLLAWPFFPAFIKNYMRVFLFLCAAVALSWILEHLTVKAKESLFCRCEILKGSKRYSCQMRGFMEALGIAWSCPLKTWRVKHIRGPWLVGRETDGVGEAEGW